MAEGRGSFSGGQKVKKSKLRLEKCTLVASVMEGTGVCLIGNVLTESY